MAIKKVLAAIPANNELSHVVAKVSLIKTLYATPIYDVFAVAESVVLPRFRLKLERLTCNIAQMRNLSFQSSISATVIPCWRAASWMLVSPLMMLTTRATLRLVVQR
jgi:hypothetical protein